MEFQENNKDIFNEGRVSEELNKVARLILE